MSRCDSKSEIASPAEPAASDERRREMQRLGNAPQPSVRPDGRRTFTGKPWYKFGQFVFDVRQLRPLPLVS